MFTGVKGELVDGLPGAEAFLIGAFKLKLHDQDPNAPLSPFYINLRVLRSYPGLLQATSQVLAGLSRELSFDRLADIPTAATPFVALMSVELGMPMISPRMDVKTHGLTGKIDGVFSQGQTALPIDDLVTKATSKIEVVKVLQGNGLVVRDVVVLFDREQGGKEELAAAGLQLHSAVTITELLDHYAERQVMTRVAHDTCMGYLRGELPSGWEQEKEPGWEKLLSRS
jgi:orotate phosphoribosyltransferase